jgi:hypothetical protein
MTMIRIFEFASLVLVAICLMPAGAHFFEMAGKMAMGKDAYFVTQPIYNGWALFGIAIALAIVSIAILTWLLRDSGLSAWFAGLSDLALIASLIWFFIRVQPMNAVTQNWTVAPENWEPVRAQWESGHMINALLTFAAFLLLSLAVVTRG